MTSRLLIICLSCLILGWPQYAGAVVTISEIAWMGSISSANHEWIELHNSGSNTDVTGWTVTDNNNLSITLSGTISSGAYVVLERNRSDGGSVAAGGTLLQNYAGALVNTGATLVLQRADGSEADRVMGGENWENIGGNNETKDTAQYTAAGWITAPPTPGRANATVASPSPVTNQTTSTGSSGRVVLTGTPAPSTKLTTPDWSLDLTLDVPDTGYVNQPVVMAATATGLGKTYLNSLQYRWNFGDFTTGVGQTATHTYAYPGSYTVVLTASFGKYSATVRRDITILPVTLSLARTASGDVILHNNAPYEVLADGLYVVGDTTLRVPADTWLAARSSITVPWQRVADSPMRLVALYDQTKQLITTTLATTPSVAATPVTPRPVAVSPPLAPLVVSISDTAASEPPPTESSRFRFATTSTSTSTGATTVTDSPLPLLAAADTTGGVGGATAAAHSTWPYLALLALFGTAFVVIFLARPPVVPESASSSSRAATTTVLPSHPRITTTSADPTATPAPILKTPPFFH